MKRKKLDEPADQSRRERQIMDAIYAAGPLSVAGVRSAIADPPSYSAVRALLRILVEKGHLKYANIGGRYVYSPIRPREAAARGRCGACSPRSSTTPPPRPWRPCWNIAEAGVSADELAELSDLIEKARQKAGKP